MKPANVLTFTVPICLLMSFKGTAQTQDAPVNNIGKAEIAKEVSLTTPIKAPLAETKLQRRKRKKGDPVLLPYRLTKKYSTLS